MITSYDELPSHFKELYKTLPPRLSIPLACDVGQSSRATIYEKAGDGRLTAVKDGGKTLIDTLSLLIDMANLPPADIAPPKCKPAAATLPRRKRDQAPAPKATPPTPPTPPPRKRGRSPKVQPTDAAAGA
jgi:hypothetical protein